MKIHEILKIEQNNINSIFLFKEGIFYRCYELSAFRFVNHFKEYKTVKKYVKVADCNIVYLGFPQNALDDLTNGISKNKIFVNENYTELTDFPETTGFEVWKEQISLTKKIEKNQMANDHAEIINKIRAYPLVNKTPMETVNFLSEIQKQIINYQ